MVINDNPQLTATRANMRQRDSLSLQVVYMCFHVLASASRQSKSPQLPATFLGWLHIDSAAEPSQHPWFVCTLCTKVQQENCCFAASAPLPFLGAVTVFGSAGLWVIAHSACPLRAVDPHVRARGSLIFV